MFILVHNFNKGSTKKREICSIQPACSPFDLIHMGTEKNMDGEDAAHQQNPYMLFLLVLVFFFTGLLGFLICHVLKKKGYRCRTSPEDLDPEAKESLKEEPENVEEISNEDTVERIVKCIIQNEANAEALKQMLGDNEGDVPIVPSLCPHRDSQDTGPPHHHTVHLGSTQAPCIHCTRKKRSLLNRMGRSKDGKGKSHPGEVTVFSVGRFRVTHIGKKQGIQGSQDGQSVNDGQISEKDNKEQPMKTSSNGIIQQQDSEDLKTQDLPKSESDVVGLAKLEVQRESAPKSVDNSRVKGLEDQFHRNSIKKLASKDRRSSAPATGQERGVITNMEETKKRQSPETASDQVQQKEGEGSSGIL